MSVTGVTNDHSEPLVAAISVLNKGLNYPSSLYLLSFSRFLDVFFLI